MQQDTSSYVHMCSPLQTTLFQSALESVAELRGCISTGWDLDGKSEVKNVQDDSR